MKKIKFLIGIASAALAMLTTASALTTNLTVTVPATSDIWLAGADSTANLFGDTIFNATPFLVATPMDNFRGGIVRFAANGSWSNAGGGQYTGPEGSGAISVGGVTNYGFGLFQTKFNSLIGVFVDATPFTNRIVPPTSTVFVGTQTLYAATVNVPFYIGSGTNNLGQPITIQVPLTAKGLYLGDSDIAAYNNPGTMTVKIFAQGNPSLNIKKAVYLDSQELLIGTNYQLQVSGDLLNWTNSGSVFTATTNVWRTTNYWDVANWNSLFFRIQQQ